MVSILLQIFFISFLINVLWELIHSQLYTTCIESPLKKLIPLLIGASLKDAFWISLFFFVSVWFFGNISILTNIFQLLSFILLSFSFSFVDEKISLNMKRWKYSNQMPCIFGVGISPLLELTTTGILSFLYVFLV